MFARIRPVDCCGSARPAGRRRRDVPTLPGWTSSIRFRPIIESHCLECHSAEKRKGGLSLATYADALDGGRNGAVIRPGNSTGSLIVQRLLGRLIPQMPKDEDPLPAATIALVRRWIDQGARETPTSPPAPPPWDAPMASTRPARTAGRVVKVERTDRPHSSLPTCPTVAPQNPRSWKTPASRVAPTWICGACFLHPMPLPPS